MRVGVWGIAPVSLLLTGCLAGSGTDDLLEAQADAEETEESLEGMTALADAPRSVEHLPGFDVGITLAGPDVVLAWEAEPDVSEYTVWHASDAYFEPGDLGSTVLASGPASGFAHPVAGDGEHHYYRVVAHTGVDDATSTTVGKYAHLLYPGFNKIPQPLDTGITTADGFAGALSGYLNVAYLFQGVSQSFQYWWPGAGFDPFAYGPGEVPIVDAGGVWGQVYEEVGHVPLEGGIALPLSPGRNLVTVPLELGDTTASELFAAVPGVWRIGRWNSVIQDRVWYEGGAGDFAIEAGRDVYVEVWESSMWPPEPGSVAAPPPTDPLEGMGAPQVVASGLMFTEGALWLPEEGVLMYTDLEADEVWRYEPNVGNTRLRAATGRFANGLAFDAQGRLIECQHATQQVVRVEADGSETILASEWQGVTLNAPDDAITGVDGSLYFTDPTIGAMTRFGNVQDMPLGTQGVYRIDPAGALHLVDDVFADPAGIALSPAGDMLYVSDWGTGIVRAYPVHDDGSTGAGEVINVEMPMADSMCVDEDGNLYVATVQGLWALRPDGTPWGVIALPEEPSNCAFGGADSRTLYITAQTSVYEVEMVIPGAPMFGG